MSSTITLNARGSIANKLRGLADVILGVAHRVSNEVPASVGPTCAPGATLLGGGSPNAPRPARLPRDGVTCRRPI
jgi:hypothetical protein